jgi:hypothetical protein
MLRLPSLRINKRVAIEATKANLAPIDSSRRRRDAASKQETTVALSQSADGALVSSEERVSEPVESSIDNDAKPNADTTSASVAGADNDNNNNNATNTVEIEEK